MDRDLYIKDLLKSKSEQFAHLYKIDTSIRDQKIKLYKVAENVASKYGVDLSSEPTIEELAQLGAEAVCLATLIAIKKNIIYDIKKISEEIEAIRHGNN